MHWDIFTDAKSADEAKGNAARKALDTRSFSKRQVAQVYSRAIAQNSEDSAALMKAVRPNATVIMQQPNLNDIFKFRIKLLSEAELNCSADEGLPDVDSIPRAFSGTQAARMTALMAVAWSKKGYVGKIPKIDDLVIVECFYSDFESSVSLENVEFVEILRSDTTPNDLQKRKSKIKDKLLALFTGDWSGIAGASAGHTSGAPAATPGGTGTTSAAQKCTTGEFCDHKYKSLFDGGARSKNPTSIVMHATAGGMGAGKALSGARRCAKKPYGPTSHERCSRDAINAGKCIEKNGNHYVPCAGGSPCTELGDPLKLKQTKVSPHYFVDQGGIVVEACSPDRIGNQAGARWNAVSIGIEHAGHPQKHESTMWTPELLKASAQLSAGLCWRYGIEPKKIATNDPSQNGFIGHEQISTDRSDPGGGFPWESYLKMVKKFIDDGNHATESPKDIASGVSAVGTDGNPHDSSPGSQPTVLLQSDTGVTHKCPIDSVWHEAGSDDTQSWVEGCYGDDGSYYDVLLT